jgi:hypothetical protein
MESLPTRRRAPMGSATLTCADRIARVLVVYQNDTGWVLSVSRGEGSDGMRCLLTLEVTFLRTDGCRRVDGGTSCPRDGG